MKPAYKIIANRADDITAAIAGRLLSLRITDNEGDQNDSLSIELENADGLLLLPAPNAQLAVSLGFEGAPLREMGTFVVDEVRESAPPNTISITAKAASYDYTRRTRLEVDAVIAVWRDRSAAQTRNERVGIAVANDNRVRRLPDVYSDSVSARRAAESALLGFRRGGTEFNLTLPAPADMAFVAEGYIAASGFRPEIDGQWKLTSVEWALGAEGLSVALKCEVPDAAKPVNGD
jgi:phage protein D